MHRFMAHRLRFVTEVQAPIELNEHQGSAIRGALFHAMRRHFCFQQQFYSCAPCPLHATCPVSFLLSTVDDEARRGADVPRPYAVQPPVRTQPRYASGERFEFGLTMFSRALNLFPYVILAVDALQREGIGRRVEGNGWQRGTFVLREVRAENPLSGERQQVMAGGDPMVSVPDVPITHEQVLQRGSGCDSRRSLTLAFLSPTRIVEQGGLLKEPLFRPLVQRLFERLSALSRAYCDTPLELDFRELLDRAEQVQLEEDRTRWVDWESYSTRRQARTPLGGLVGQATYSGDLAPFVPWLVWGQYTHVGKDAVKGNGLYELRCN